jgi:hypothetical protein
MQSVVPHSRIIQIGWSAIIKSSDRIFLGSNAAIPNALVDKTIENGKVVKILKLPISVRYQLTLNT